MSVKIANDIYVKQLPVNHLKGRVLISTLITLITNYKFEIQVNISVKTWVNSSSQCVKKLCQFVASLLILVKVF